MKLVLPIYWTDVKIRVPSVTYLVGMNWYSKANYHLKNKVKRDYHELVANQTLNFKPVNKFRVTYVIYYKSVISDGSNIAAVIEKFVLDGLKLAGVITDDNVKFHLGSTWKVQAQDKTDPRVEIHIEEVE